MWLLTLLLVCCVCSPTVIYVNHAAPPNGDGSCWAKAFTSLQQALTNNSEQQVWVAQGTYTSPSSLVISSGISLCGGFRGDETKISQRRPDLYPTILLGDGDHNIITISGGDSTAVTTVSGFTIKDGRRGIVIKGGNVMITSTTFVNNTADYGGAMVISDGSQVTLVSSNFFENSAISGGAINSVASNLTISMCNFTGNYIQKGSLGGGGAVYFSTGLSSDVFVLSVDMTVFLNNTASSLGGGAISVIGGRSNLLLSYASISLCTFYGNSGGIGGAVHIDSFSATLFMCTFNYNVGWDGGAGLAVTSFVDSTFEVVEFDGRSSVKVEACTFANGVVNGEPQGEWPIDVVMEAYAGQLVEKYDLPPAKVYSVEKGGGGIVSYFGGKVYITATTFSYNTVVCDGCYGGAVLVGGGKGNVNNNTLGYNQGYVSVLTSTGKYNKDTNGYDNIQKEDPAGVGEAEGNGVKYETDGSMV